MAVKVIKKKSTKEEVANPVSRLPEYQLADIDRMMKSGFPIDFIVSTIQDEWDLFTDVTPGKVAGMLKKYKSASISPADIVEQASPRLLTKAVEEVKQYMNTFDIYADLIDLQRRRVEMAMRTEMQTGKLDRACNDAIATLNSTIKNHADVSIKVGLLQRTLDGDKTGPSYEPQNLAQALGDEIVRNEVINTLDSMLSDIEALPPPKKVEELEYDPE